MAQAAEEKSDAEGRLAEATDNIAMQDKITQSLQAENDQWNEKFEAEVAQRAEVQAALDAANGEQEHQLSRHRIWKYSVLN